MTLFPKNVDHQLRDRRLIFDDENASWSVLRGFRRGGGENVGEGVWNRDDRQVDDETGARAGPAFEGDFSAMLMNDAVDDGEPQAGSCARRLTCEKRLEDTRRVFGRDAGPIIRHLKNNVIVWLRAAHDEAGANAHVAVAAILEQSLLGVDEQIEHDLLKLERIGDRLRESGRKIGEDLDIFHFQFVTTQGEGALDHLV